MNLNNGAKEPCWCCCCWSGGGTFFTVCVINGSHWTNKEGEQMESSTWWDWYTMVSCSTLTTNPLARNSMLLSERHLFISQTRWKPHWQLSRIWTSKQTNGRHEPIHFIQWRILNKNRKTEAQTCFKHVKAKGLFSVSCSLQCYVNYRPAATLGSNTHTSCSIHPCNLQQFHQSVSKRESKR